MTCNVLSGQNVLSKRMQMIKADLSQITTLIVGETKSQQSGHDHVNIRVKKSLLARQVIVSHEYHALSFRLAPKTRELSSGCSQTS